MPSARSGVIVPTMTARIKNMIEAGFDPCDGCSDVDAIMELPSAQPERKPGKWEIYVISMFDGEGCRCSECGFEGAPYWDFCPGCGADMRGEQDDQRKSD